MEKERNLGIDILKIIMAILIFAGHSINMWGRTWGVYTDWILKMRGIVMTLFFIVSGYTMTM